jgi:hypothetical protein
MVAGAFLPGFSTPPTCTGGAGFGGNGTVGSPWVGATSCTLPYGSRIDVQSFSFYTVKAADFSLANHRLLDDAFLAWHDTCDASSARVPPVTNCAPNPPAVSAASSSLVVVPTTTTTTIHDAAHNPVLVVEAGTTVHDSVTVAGAPGTPVPVGKVTLDWFTNFSCQGAPAATSDSTPLVNGTADVTAFQRGPLAAGLYSFRAHFTPEDGSGFVASVGDCEPLRVVDANIKIAADGVNRVGQPHTFTAQVKVDYGTGEANAPDGIPVAFTITSNGSTTPAGNCVTAGNTGSCSISLSSALTGVWSVRASASAFGVTRTTNGVAPNSGPAVKRWVNAKIAIAPNAVNAVGDPHTFVATLSKDTGDGSGFVPAAGEHVTVSLADSLGASAVVDAAASTCDNAGANTNAAGQCTLVVRSATPGKVTAHASSTLSVAGSAPFTVVTNGSAPNSGDAVKTYVDASIQITPQVATNPVGSPHVLTAHVNVNPGTGFVDAPNGTQIGFSIVSGPGTLAQSSCVTSANTGSCQVTLNSATPGTTVVRASVTTTVNTVPLTRATDGTGASSGPATKQWADAGVRTDIHNTAHGVILTANAGDVVHDKVFVTKLAGTPASVPNPTGNVVFHRYSTINCIGSTVDQTVALGADGTAETSTFTVSGDMSYRADYLGDAVYPARQGACEPLTVKTTEVCVPAKDDDQKHGLRKHGSRHLSSVKTGGHSSGECKASVRTDIHNSKHEIILSAAKGTVVHDKVFVTKASGTPAGAPNPTGNVVFHRYSTINCTGSSVKQTVTLSNGTGETGTTTVTGAMSYRAEYLGDSLYDPAWGPCEPLEVETKCPDRRTSGVKTGGGGYDCSPCRDSKHGRHLSSARTGGGGYDCSPCRDSKYGRHLSSARTGGGGYDCSPCRDSKHGRHLSSVKTGGRGSNDCDRRR